MLHTLVRRVHSQDNEPGEVYEHVDHVQDLGRARVVTSALVNGAPQTHIELAEGVRLHVMGEALSTVEQQWLAAQMNDHIEVRTNL